MLPLHKNLRFAVAFHQHLLNHLQNLLCFRRVITSFILLGSPAISGHVDLPVAVKADNFSSLSSVIATLSLGLSLCFFWAVSLHVSRFFTPVTIPQVVECVLTLRIEYGCLSQCRVGSCIDDRSVLYWGCDRVNLHSDILFYPGRSLLQTCTHPSVQSCLGLNCSGVYFSYLVLLTDLL